MINSRDPVKAFKKNPASTPNITFSKQGTEENCLGVVSTDILQVTLLMVKDKSVSPKFRNKASISTEVILSNILLSQRQTERNKQSISVSFQETFFPQKKSRVYGLTQKSTNALLNTHLFLIQQ